jgi:hypothetical protein
MKRSLTGNRSNIPSAENANIVFPEGLHIDGKPIDEHDDLTVEHIIPSEIEVKIKDFSVISSAENRTKRIRAHVLEANEIFHEWLSAVEDAAAIDQTLAGRLVDMLVPADRAEDMRLEMQKSFEQRWLPKYGPRRARQVYLLQSIGVVVRYWINWIKQHLGVSKFFAS